MHFHLHMTLNFLASNYNLSYNRYGAETKGVNLTIRVIAIN